MYFWLGAGFSAVFLRACECLNSTTTRKREIIQSESTKECKGGENNQRPEEFTDLIHYTLGMFDFVRIRFIDYMRATLPSMTVCCGLKG